MAAKQREYRASPSDDIFDVGDSSGFLQCELSSSSTEDDDDDDVVHGGDFRPAPVDRPALTAPSSRSGNVASSDHDREAEAVSLKAAVSRGLMEYDVSSSRQAWQEVEARLESPTLSAVECWPSAVSIDGNGGFHAAATIVVHSIAAGLGNQRIRVTSDIPALFKGTVGRGGVIMVDEIALQMEVAA